MNLNGVVARENRKLRFYRNKSLLDFVFPLVSSIIDPLIVHRNTRVDMSDNTRGMVEFDPLFDNLIGFFSPNLSPSIKSTWVERGGRIVNFQRLQSVESVPYRIDLVGTRLIRGELIKN
jgi:hypothetical protein